jgi:hypothetical protein
LAHQAAQAAVAATSDLAEAVREQVRAELVALIHAVVDAKSYEQAEAALVTLLSHPQGAALVTLLSHPQGAALGQFLNEQLDRILVHLGAYYASLQRVTPEWYWRDFRLRLSRAAAIMAQTHVWSRPPWSGHLP